MSTTKNESPNVVIASLFLALMITFDRAELSLWYVITTLILAVLISIIFTLVEIGLSMLNEKLTR